MSPDVQGNVSFYVSPPQSQASYTAAVAVSYESGGLGHASLATFKISAGKSQQINFGTAALAAAAFAVAALVVLLIRSSIRKRGRRPAA